MKAMKTDKFLVELVEKYRLVTIEEAAHYAGVSERTVRRYHAGTTTSVRLSRYYTALLLWTLQHSIYTLSRSLNIHETEIMSDRQNLITTMMMEDLR